MPMADRAAKRLRRLSTDYDESDATDDWNKGHTKGSNAPSAPAPTASSTRPRRNTASRAPPAAVVQRSSPEESRHSLNLTVKASPGKLRDATATRASTAVSSRNIVAGKRARNSRVVREIDSDDEDDDDDQADEVDAMDVDDDDDEDEEDDDGDGDDDDDVQVDADGDDDDDDDDEMDAEGEEDDDMEVTPAPRIVVPSNKNVPVKQKVAQDSVEAKEMAMDDDDDDDELSELDSELEGEDEDAEGEDDDAEGEEDDKLAAANDDDDDDEEMDSDEDLSRDQTPDLSKMTRRQQAMVVQGADDGLMALSNEAQKKKHLTAEEITSRRAEMARRRKNLSEKRNEEEKADTINRLLKKQPPKRGRKGVVLEDTESGQQEDEKKEPEKINPIFIRYKQNKDGTSLGVPDEWLQAPAGAFFNGKLARPASRPFSGRMVEEVS